MEFAHYFTMNILAGHHYNIQLIKIPLLLLVFGDFSKAAKKDSNLALNKPTRQSTTLNWLQLSNYAVDGNFGSSIYQMGARCAQTGGDKTNPWAWWLVDLRKVYTVGSYSFTSRSDANHWYNTNFAVEVSIKDPTTLDGFPARTKASECLVKNTTNPWTIAKFTMQCKKPVRGRYVRVVKYPHKGKLVICEFEVFETAKGVREASTDRINLALVKPTSIDGTSFQTSPSKITKHSQYMAVDGKVDGYMGSAGICYYTFRQVDPRVSPLIPFIVDLEDTYVIDTIFITNCLDHQYRHLQNFSVEVSMQVPPNAQGNPNDSNIQVCFRQIEPVPIGYMVEYKCNQPIAGRYVRLVKFIQSPSKICLCEFQVYGEPFYASSQSTELPTSSTNSLINFGSTQPRNVSVLDADKALTQIWCYVFIKSSGASALELNSIRRKLSHCARSRLGVNINTNSKKYVLTDTQLGECYFVDSVEETKSLPFLDWVIYKLEY